MEWIILPLAGLALSDSCLQLRKLRIVDILPGTGQIHGESLRFGVQSVQ